MTIERARMSAIASTRSRLADRIDSLAAIFTSDTATKAAIEPGWTHSVDEDYCSNCAAMRAQTWPRESEEGTP